MADRIIFLGKNKPNIKKKPPSAPPSPPGRGIQDIIIVKKT